MGRVSELTPSGVSIYLCCVVYNRLVLSSCGLFHSQAPRLAKHQATHPPPASLPMEGFLIGLWRPFCPPSTSNRRSIGRLLIQCRGDRQGDTTSADDSGIEANISRLDI